MKKSSIHKAWWILLLLPLLAGCNESDDLQKIFTGKTWRLTYINLKDKGGFMSGFTEESMKKFNEDKEAYTLTFTGTENDNNTISGNVTGKILSSHLNGTWNANGKNNRFSTHIATVSETDALAKEYIKGLTNASSYMGDEKNLFLYYQPSGSQQTYVLAFHLK